MPETTISQVDQVAATLRAVDGLDDDQVVVGYATPQRLGRELVVVAPINEPVTEGEGFTAERRLYVLIGAMLELDPGKESERWRQLMTKWAGVEAAVEQIIRDNNNGKADRVSMSESGVEWDSFELERKRFVFVGCELLIEWERALGTIQQPS